MASHRILNRPLKSSYNAQVAPSGLLILASASSRRINLLRKMGIPFRVCATRVRERTLEEFPFWTPRQLAMYNAQLKAQKVARRCPHHWVLGADTIVVLGHTLFGKPRDFKEAEFMLMSLSARTHRVITGVCLCRWGVKTRSFAVTTRVSFRKLTQRQIRNYLKQVNPLDKAGAYAAQLHKHRVIRFTEGSFSNVIGLPMGRLTREWKSLCANHF